MIEYYISTVNNGSAMTSPLGRHHVWDVKGLPQGKSPEGGDTWEIHRMMFTGVNNQRQQSTQLSTCGPHGGQTPIFMNSVNYFTDMVGS